MGTLKVTPPPETADRQSSHAWTGFWFVLGGETSQGLKEGDSIISGGIVVPDIQLRFLHNLIALLLIDVKRA